MKLEIAVRAEDDMVGSVVEKLLVRPNDVVKGGDALVLTRKTGTRTGT
jgi:biotin carboxyl carrier protein